MSIIVAVKKRGVLAVACDTQTNFGSHRVTPDNHLADKIHEVGGSLVGVTGWALYEDILQDFLARKPVPRFESKPEIFRVMLRLWKQLHEVYPYVNDQPDPESHSPFGDLDATFLIANRKGIFMVESDLSITVFEKYFAVGSGGDYAMGALHVLYETDLNAEQIARRAVEAAIAFNVHCGGEIITKKVGLR